MLTYVFLSVRDLRIELSAMRRDHWHLLELATKCQAEELFSLREKDFLEKSGVVK
jgi:hypothetical protein